MQTNTNRAGGAKRKPGTFNCVDDRARKDPMFCLNSRVLAAIERHWNLAPGTPYALGALGSDIGLTGKASTVKIRLSRVTRKLANAGYFQIQTRKERGAALSSVFVPAWVLPLEETGAAITDNTGAAADDNTGVAPIDGEVLPPEATYKNKPSSQTFLSEEEVFSEIGKLWPKQRWGPKSKALAALRSALREHSHDTIVSAAQTYLDDEGKKEGGKYCRHIKTFVEDHLEGWAARAREKQSDDERWDPDLKQWVAKASASDAELRRRLEEFDGKMSGSTKVFMSHIKGGAR